MCRHSTGLLRTVALAALCSCLYAQTAPPQTDAARPGSWRAVGGTSIAEGLAGPAGGAAADVWFSPGGDRLFVRTASGRVFETADPASDEVSGWRLSTSAILPTRAAAAARTAQAAGRLYRVGSSEVFTSQDDGFSWIGLTALNGRSVLGGGFTSIAVSPANPLEVVVANSFGVWRSADGGTSWRGVNDGLPNLPVRKLAGRLAIVLESGAAAEIAGGVWVASGSADPEDWLRLAFSATAGAPVTSAAQTSAVSYAGTADGRLLASRDRGATWPQIQKAPSGGPVNRIWVDDADPELALASAGGRLLRTVNGGAFWDDVSGSLPDSAIHGITADTASDRVWIATDHGVFAARIPLTTAALASPDWTSAGTGLPAAVAWDVRLNNDNTLEVALDGYGVFESEQPLAGSVHVANGADLSNRAAAPGSLISIVGAQVTAGKSGDTNWPVLAVSAQSSQLQVPFETGSGALSLALTTSGGVFTVPVRVKEASPAIFVDSDGAPLLLDPASGLVLDPKSAVAPGSAVEIMATGLGRVNPDWPTGIPAPSETPPAVRGSVTAFLDGTPLEVAKATLAPGYVGYYVVGLKIPAAVSRGIRELRIVMNGQESNPVKLFIDNTAAASELQ